MTVQNTTKRQTLTMPVKPRTQNVPLEPEPVVSHVAKGKTLPPFHYPAVSKSAVTIISAASDLNNTSAERDDCPPADNICAKKGDIANLIRFLPANPDGFKSRARLLRRAFKAGSVELGLNAAYNLLAKLCGRCSWPRLVQDCAVYMPSIFDQDAIDEVVQSRRAHQLHVLQSIGFSEEVPKAILDDVRPTGTWRPGSEPASVGTPALSPDAI